MLLAGRVEVRVKASHAISLVEEAAPGVGIEAADAFAEGGMLIEAKTLAANL